VRAYRCPLRSISGLPCPTCGATRAFLLVVARDPAWRSHNVLPVIYAGMSLASGLALLLLPRPVRDAVERRAASVQEALSSHGRLAAAAYAALALPAWLVALRRYGATPRRAPQRWLRP